MPDEIIDIAIVGAGVAGTYSAWRLVQDPAHKNKKIKVFDFLKIRGKAHVGGRLWSPHLPGLGHTRKAEMGGMRYLTSQPLVTNLVEHLGMKSVPFVTISNQTLFSLRSSIFRADEVREPHLIPYKLGPLEKGKSPSELLLYASETILPNAPYLTPEEWDERKENAKFDGIHLYKLGFWNLLERILTSEGYKFGMAGQGYDTFLSNWNAADAIEFLHSGFGSNVSYRYIAEGCQELPVRLLEQALEQGVLFEKNHRLKGWSKVVKNGEELVKLVFENPEDESEKPIIVLARQLILAMPKKSLELIDMPQTPETQHFYQNLLPAVEPKPMFKFFLGYDYPWWRVLGMTAGQTITDNPLRQVYYWGSNYQKFFKEAPAETGGIRNDPENSTIMVYLDGRDLQFWQPLFESISHHNKSRHNNSTHFDVLKASYSLREKLIAASGQSELWQHSPGKKFIMDSEIDQAEMMEDALENLENTITNLLRQTHGINYVPKPYTFAFADWTADPFGGAYNLWKPGYKSWVVTKEIIKPFAKSPVFIVGEAYSTKQGWIEGALETTEQMLESYLGLSRPTWLPATNTESKSYIIELR